MDILQAALNRRSVRRYTDAPISEEALQKVLQVGLLAPSSKNCRPWEFIVVNDKALLQQLAQSRAAGLEFVAEANCAVVIAVDTQKSDVWVEDGAAAAALMHLEADSLGLGSCWGQLHNRTAADGTSTAQLVQAMLGLPEHLQPVCALALGSIDAHPRARTTEVLLYSKIHQNRY